MSTDYDNSVSRYRTLKMGTPESTAKLWMRGGPATDEKLAPEMVVRQWTGLDAQAAEAMVDFMKVVALYNLPLVDLEELDTPGAVWINGDVRAIAEPGDKRWVTIRQTLYSVWEPSVPEDEYYTRFKQEYGPRTGNRMYVRYWPNLRQDAVDSLITLVEAAGEFTVGGVTYENFSYRIVEHPEMGLKDFIQTGVRGRLNIVGEFVYKIYFTTDEPGQPWRVTLSRKYGQTLDDAKTFAQLSDNRFTKSGVRGEKGGMVKHQYGTKYMGEKEQWKQYAPGTESF